MELCSDDLKNILKMKPQFFGRQNGEPMDLYEYFISCELFREILERVQYLHELDPQIIHRDLKPENILIDRHGRDVHDKRIHGQTRYKHTADVGDIHYEAPESNTIFYRYDQF
ncbi:unnamed protein product [Oppiella nova]|uniref:non-specific serine/threonine protein kinase n=1 Tax=Oppiella nova TaxID=334625 RepID=A0A7R9LVI3_9ACAR|nr:unnamed protein product [Oppiella nova]CAG2167064.1 unnamed protein product [Oppiella nova]